MAASRYGYAQHVKGKEKRIYNKGVFRMKKFYSLLLAILTVCTLVLGMCGCGSASNSAVVGVWKSELQEKETYMYVYKDGTGDFYQYIFPIDPKPEHCNAFEWKIEGEYFAFGVQKFTVDGDSMYNKQGKIAYTKVSNDPSKDL